MASGKLHRASFIITVLLASWLAMTALHECGHVLNAWLSGGRVLGIGSFFGDPNGADDAHELLRHGAGAWELVVFGVTSVAAGLAVWHCLGPRAGFSRAASLAGWRSTAVLVTVIAVLLATGCFLP